VSRLFFEALFDEPRDTEQPLTFGTAGVLRGHCVSQELNRYDEMFAAVSFGEPRYVRETWPEFVHRRDKESTEVHGEAGCRSVAARTARPDGEQPECRTPDQMRMANAFCRYWEMAEKVKVI